MRKAFTRQAIIFDLGNVIINVSYNRAFDYWSTITGTPPHEISNKFPIPDEHRFEKGVITPEIFRELVMTKTGLQLSDTEFDTGWNRILMDPISGIDQLLIVLKPHYRLTGLSNTNEIHAQKWKSDYAGILTHFEKFFSSHELGLRKPDPKIFEAVLNHLNLPAHQVTFIDDNPENVRAAILLGLNGIVMRNLPQLVKDLKMQGIYLGNRTFTGT